MGGFRRYPALSVATALMLALTASPATPAHAPAPRAGAAHAVPLHGDLIRPWDAPPDNPYAPGHRGVDVAAPAGTAVRASAAGVVGFAGNVAGNLTVSVDHGGGLRTTASYLGSLAVATGQPVTAGQVVGTSGAGHPGSELPPHVHLSARRDGVYFDPLELYVGSAYDDLVALVA
ncbi:MAG TPA: M23 family metallopeptidase [Actinomycetota bacterium]|nr:M23 family metallopeptidase [Actinomycetota bacterium]